MFKGLIFFIKQGWKYDKRYILWRVLYQIVNSLIPITITLAPKFIIDELMGQKRPERLFLYVSILAGYTLIATVLSVYFNMDGFTRRCRVNTKFDLDLHRRLSECDFENLENPEFLDMQEKAKKFLYCDWHGFGYLLDCAMNIVGQLITLLGVAAIIGTLHIGIVLLFVLLALLGTTIEGKAKKRAMQLSNAISADNRGALYYAKLFDDFGYGKELRMNCIGQWLLQTERKYEEHIIQNLKQQNDGFIKSGTIGALFTFLQQCISYGYLISQAISGGLSVGSFTMYTGAVTTFASSLRNVMDSLVEIRAYDMYYNNLDKYLNVPVKLRANKKLPLPQGEHKIEFKNVSFRYAGQECFAVKNINITLTPGEKLSIVGENGAGKSTFVKLLTRLYDPTEGEILLDGVNIRDIDYDSYMSLFSAVFQDYKLFSFSLKQNVALALPLNDNKVKNVLERIGFGEKLGQLTKGIDTAVYKNFDETGFEPSGGEGQKIALARALYRDTPIVVLDEPTAALDPRAESLIYQNFSELVRGKTAVYISHRLSSSKFCDKIAVFEKGNIVEYGTHEELMKKGGKYAELFSMQARLYV